MSRSSYSRITCFICKRDISTAGFAQFNHKMKHVREGKMRRIKLAYRSGFSADDFRFEIVKDGSKR